MAGEVKQRSPGSWQIRVFLGRDEHGKRIRKNETIRGKKADAERRLREILGQMDRGVVPSLERYKLAEWLELWLNDVIAPNRSKKRSTVTRASFASTWRLTWVAWRLRSSGHARCKHWKPNCSTKAWIPLGSRWSTTS